MSDSPALPDRSGSIYLGDAYKLLLGLPPDSVKLLLTDPPYNVGRANNLHTMGRSGFDFEWDGGFNQTSWLALAAPAIMPGGSIVIWNDWKNLGEIALALKQLGFDPKRPLLWRKSNPIPRNRDRSFVQGHEFAIWAVKGGGSWTFHRRPNMGYERGEFSYPIQQKAAHPAKKPNGLFQEIIEILTDPGDLVLDPFAGEGTTAIASELTRRRHISFELDEKWYALALAALKLAQAEPKASMPKAPRRRRSPKTEATDGLDTSAALGTKP